MGDSRVATGLGDQSIERRGIGPDRHRIGKTRMTASGRVMTLPATPKTYSDTGSDTTT